MESGQSQILQRNAELFEQGSWLFLNPVEPQIVEALDNPNISAFYQYFDLFQTASSQQQKHFGAAATAYKGNAFDGAVVFLSKSKAHTQMLIDNACAIVKQGGTIAIVGSNDSGIKSLGKTLKKQFPSAQKYDSARHCAIWLVQNTEPRVFNLSEYEQVKTYQCAGMEWQVMSLPGVFSADALDPGSALLLESVDSLNGQNILDFACGAGVIGSFLNLKFPDCKISYSDINALALHACERTLALNGLSGDIKPSNGVKEWQSQFSHVVTNPPFHTGKATDYAITETFIHDVSGVLEPKGQVTIVANRLLPYPDIISKVLNRLPDVARSNKFCVYHATKK